MKRIFTLLLGALAMVTVALISAFIAMRLAIHGREAVVPALTGLTVSDAAVLTRHEGLNLTLENRFYATGVPAGRIIAQDPEPGSRVRREWPVRITESLGSQRVSVPDLTGESERAATVSIRRLSLDLGVVAYLPVPADPGSDSDSNPDAVLTQTPLANSGGDSPRVSILVSDLETNANSAYVMPSLLGLTWPVAEARASIAGLHLIVDPATPPSTPSSPAPNTPTPSASTPVTPATSPETPNPSAPRTTPTPPAQTAGAAGTIVSQIPQAGRRVFAGDAVHVTLVRLGAASAPLTSP